MVDINVDYPNIEDIESSYNKRIHLNNDKRIHLDNDKKKIDNKNKHKILVKVNGEYVKPCPYQEIIALSFIDLGTNWGSPLNFITTKINGPKKNGRYKYKYYGFFNVKNGNIYIINDTTKKIRHIKYQREGLIVEENLKRQLDDDVPQSNKKLKSSS